MNRAIVSLLSSLLGFEPQEENLVCVGNELVI